MICSACEEYAALSSNDAKKAPLCGNCDLLKPEELKTVIKAREAKAKIKSGNMDVGRMIAELTQENAQLMADKEKLVEEKQTLTEELAKAKAPKPQGQQQAAH